MQELDKLFSRVQKRQPAAKAIKETKEQLMQQAVRREDAHEELANALIKSKIDRQEAKA